MSDYDVIIIGANSPALVAASYLGKLGGLKSLILEKTQFVGGAAISSKDMIPGYVIHPAATGEYWVDHMLEHDFGITKYGIEVIPAKPKLTSLLGDGKYISFYDDLDATAEEIGRFSKKDAAAYKPFMERWLKVGQFMGMALANPAVPFSQFVASMSATPEMEELMRDMLFGTIKGELNKTFENEYVKTAFLPFMEGSTMGPACAPFFFTVGRVFSPWGFAKGGLHTIIEALQKVAAENGATIRTNAEVVKILVKDGKAYGVRLASGEEITADNIITHLEPAKTFFDLVGSEHLQSNFIQKVNRIDYECMGVTLNLALSGMPDFGIPEEKYHGFIGVVPSFEYAEKAYYESTIGEIPEKPCSIGYFGSVVDPSFAPAGCHELTMFVFPTPGKLKKGSWESRKEELLDKWVDSLAEFAPNIKQLVVGRAGYSPLELEQKFGMTNGDLGHGSIRWGQQLSWRPMVGYANNRTPIAHLYMSGQGTHPTSSIAGINGRSVALAIIEDAKKGKKK